MLIRRVRRASLLALYGLFTALLPGTAHAIGLCEGGSTTYALVEIAPRAGLLAIAVESRTCSVKETGDSIAEDWRTERSVLVTDLALREQGLYAADSAKPSGAPSIDSAKPSGAPSNDSQAAPSDGDIKPAAAWQALRAQKGFQPIDQIAPSPRFAEIDAASFAVHGPKEGQDRDAWRKTYSDHFPVVTWLKLPLRR